MFCKRSYRFAFTVVFGGCLVCILVFFPNGNPSPRWQNEKGLTANRLSTAAIRKLLAGHAVKRSGNTLSSAHSVGLLGDESAKTSTVSGARSTTSLPCTQAHIDRRSVVLTTTNAGFLDVTENMLESIRRTRTCPNITVIAEDEPSYQRLTGRIPSQPGLHVQRSDLGATVSGSMMVGSPEYNRFVNRRPHYILSLLHEGQDVLFVDSDTFWFKDPFKDFQDTFDIAMLNELEEPRFLFCDGFAYYRQTENTLDLVKLWVSSLEETPTPDQIILNQLISNELVPGLAIKSLNPSNYPDGRRYFQTPGWRERNNDTVVLHLSFILGHDSKVDKLKNNGWWLV